nr:hypothetical protein [Tanacetum cinerariifolium]
MATLTDKAILSGADNRPPMLEKDMYDSWKSKMELYMMNRQYERMILESVENSLLIWPSIEKNRVTRPKKYSELSAKEAIQADCDVKSTNIILQGLPPKVYALQGDDPIDAINHMMSFLSAVITSRYPTTNNQLRNLSNPRKQATINDGRITLQPVRGRQISFASGTSRTYTPGCTKPKRKRDDSWFKDKVLLVQAQANGQILHEEKLAFLADLGITEVALMANLSHYGSDALAKVHNPDNVDTNMINQVVKAMPSSEQSNVMNHSETEITSDNYIIPYSQYEQVKVLKEGQHVALKSTYNFLDSYAQSVEIDLLKQSLSEHLKEKESLMQTVTLLKNDFKKEESKNIDKEIALKKRIKQLDNIVFKRDQSAQTVYMLTQP